MRKIAAYCIAKNEEHNVDRMMDSANALGFPVFALDTGSTDGTASRLRERGARVSIETFESWKSVAEYHEIKKRGGRPWRFDVARNHALALVPEEFDTCAVVDLDEVLEPACKLLYDLPPHVTMVRHLHRWDMQRPWIITEQTRFHSRTDYGWHYPAHEIFRRNPNRPEHEQFIEYILTSHYPNSDRSHYYAHMIELALQENPGDARCQFVMRNDVRKLATGAFERGQYHEALDYFKQLDDGVLSSFDQAYVKTMIGRCLAKLGEPELEMLEKACHTHRRRESFVALAEALLAHDMFNGAFGIAKEAMEIIEGMSSVCFEPEAWTFKPYEIAMSAAHALGDWHYSEFGVLALDRASGPDRERIVASHCRWRKRSKMPIDENYKPEETVILHHVASRELRSKVGGSI